MAEMGMIAPGEQFVREAIQIYESIPQFQSRTACLKSLGDVLKIIGEHNNARTAYCEGLAFWENEGHNHWTARFRQRLESWDSQNDSGSENGILKEQNSFPVEDTQG